jgi:hypothetical protein
MSTTISHQEGDAMAVPPPPYPNDLSGLPAILEWVRGWLTPLFTGGILGMAVLGGRKLQIVQDHSDTLARHAVEIENLRKAQNDANIRIAELPNREDLRDLGNTMHGQIQAAVSQMQSQIQGAVSQIGQMIAANHRDGHNH